MEDIYTVHLHLMTLHKSVLAITKKGQNQTEWINRVKVHRKETSIYIIQYSINTWHCGIDRLLAVRFASLGLIEKHLSSFENSLVFSLWYSLSFWPAYLKFKKGAPIYMILVTFTDTCTSSHTTPTSQKMRLLNNPYLHSLVKWLAFVPPWPQKTACSWA